VPFHGVPLRTHGVLGQARARTIAARVLVYARFLVLSIIERHDAQ
jgi:hypothetical protein